MKLLATLLIPFVVMAGELTLTFRPVITFSVETGHVYRVWSREDMRDPWVNEFTVISTNTPYEFEYDYTFIREPMAKFWWLQVDDEELVSKVPVNNVSTNAMPPPPGG